MAVDVSRREQASVICPCSISSSAKVFWIMAIQILFGTLPGNRDTDED